MNPLSLLEEWYAGVCDGDWEHTFGVRIGTLDNPGWSLEIALEETALEAHTLDRMIVERTSDDWYHCWVEKKIFNGCGGPRNLSEMLEVFHKWRKSAIDIEGTPGTQ